MHGGKQPGFLHVPNVGATHDREKGLKTLLGIYSMNGDPSLDTSSTLALWFSSKSANRLCLVQVKAMEGVKLMGWLHLDIKGISAPSWLHNLKGLG